MARRGFQHGRGVSIRFRDPRTGKSLSITVYGGRLEEVARHGEYAFSGRWKTTSLTDRRHKRRHGLGMTRRDGLAG